MVRKSDEARSIAIAEHGEIANSFTLQQLVAVYSKCHEWACENCHKTGIAVKIVGTSVRTRDCICKVLRKKKKAVEEFRLNSGIPPSYRDATLSNWVNTGVDSREQSLNAASFHTVEVYSKDIKRMFANGYGLYITGPNGVGKTYLACAVGNRAISLGFDVRYATMSYIIQTEIKGWRDEEASTMMRDIRKSNLLIIDDIDKIYKTKTGIETSLFDNLLRERLQSNQPCIFTSNRTIVDAADDFGNSVMSMLMEHCAEIVIVGFDFRRNLSEDIRRDILNGS